MEPRRLNRIEGLRRVAFLKGLPQDALEAIARAGEERILARGELLFAEGDRCLGLIVVLAGAVKVYKLDHRGRELTLDREMPGESVVELPLFDGGNYPASGEAAEEATLVFVVRRERFVTLMAEYPQIAAGGLRAMAIRMRKLMQAVEAQALHSVRARCAAYLLETSAGRTAFALTDTNEAIAARLGTVREVVSRTWSGFREAGLICLSGRVVTVCDPDALRRIADGSG